MNDESRASKGIGSFFYAAIPATIGLGAIFWLFFYSDWVHLGNDVKQMNHQDAVSQRMDNRVGANPISKAPVKLTELNNNKCFKITKSFLDGDSVTMYVHNDCHAALRYQEWHWGAYGPDGTLIKRSYDDSVDELAPGDTIEHTMNLAKDERTVEIKIWVEYFKE